MFHRNLLINRRGDRADSEGEMTKYLDLSWLGRPPGIRVKDAKQIEEDARKERQWWRILRRLKRAMGRG